MDIKIGDELFLSNGEESLVLRAVTLTQGRTSTDRIRSMSDKEIVELLSSVFCAGMVAQEHGDDFLHSFPWTLDRLRKPAAE